MFLLRKRTNSEKGFILLGVIVPLFAMIILTASIAALVASRWQETQSAIDQGMMVENEDAVLWVLRYYYHNAAVSATSPLNDAGAAQIVTQSLVTLGYTGGGPGTWATLSLPSNPDGLQLRITPVSITNLGPPATLSQTGTFLDGRQVSQGRFVVTIEQRSGTSTNELQQTATLVFCQIPSDSLALSSLASLSNLSGNLASFNVGGTTFVRGQLSGAAQVDFSTSNALMAGSFGDNISRGGNSMESFVGQNDYRYLSEIAQGRTDLTQSSSDLRVSSAQRAAALRSPLPPAAMLQEGVAGNPLLSPTQSALYRNNQPFYAVPQSNRYWLTHDPSTGSLGVASSEFGESQYSSGPLPPVGGWVMMQNIKNVGGNNQVVIRIDPTQAPSPLFIGSIKNGTFGDYSDFIIEVDSAPSLPNDFQLISPNTIVIGGDINTDNAHNLSLLGGQVYFGYNHLDQVTFTGSMASLGGNSPTPWRNANGIEHAVAQVTLQERPTLTSPIYYYVTLLQRQN